MSLRFKATITIEESGDFEGLWEVSVEERYTKRFQWVGPNVSAGIGEAVKATQHIQISRKRKQEAVLNEARAHPPEEELPDAGPGCSTEAPTDD